MRKPRATDDAGDGVGVRETLIEPGGGVEKEKLRITFRDWLWYAVVTAVVVVWCVCASTSSAASSSASTAHVRTLEQHGTQLHQQLEITTDVALSVNQSMVESPPSAQEPHESRDPEEQTADANLANDTDASTSTQQPLEPVQPQHIEYSQLNETHASASTSAPEPTAEPTLAAERPLNSTSVKIPHIIHQMWKTNTQIPSRFQPWIRSWVDKHPGWQYVFWTFEDQVALFESLYPKYLPIVRNLTMVSVSDMARYAALHHYGGLYVDLDFECLKPFDQLHRDNDAFLSYEPGPHAVLLENSVTPAICNAILASAPGNPFWLQVLENIYVAWKNGASVLYPINLTGPHMVKSTYEEYSKVKDDVRLLPPEFFYPEIAYWNMEKMRTACAERKDEPAVQKVCAWMDEFPHGEFTPNTHATHHWQCTWCLGDGENTYVTLAEIMRVSNDSDLIVFRPEFYDDAGVNQSRLAYYDLSQPSAL
ncbi:hypothetical protein PINS_up011975 [Pythium insidiosum]|nr:hypothetical protein PINS_up011975 [Pythium insidiosum]